MNTNYPGTDLIDISILSIQLDTRHGMDTWIHSGRCNHISDDTDLRKILLDKPSDICSHETRACKNNLHPVGDKQQINLEIFVAGWPTDVVRATRREVSMQGLCYKLLWLMIRLNVYNLLVKLQDNIIYG